MMRACTKILIENFNLGYWVTRVNHAIPVSDWLPLSRLKQNMAHFSTGIQVNCI